MKKLILLSMIFFCSFSYGQKFILTPNGLRDSLNIEKSYVVINVEGKTAKQLYDNALKFINKSYKNPSEVIKGNTESEYLKFVTHDPDFLTLKSLGMTLIWGGSYTTELSFKDGKVKYEIINLEMRDEINGTGTFPLKGGIFKNDGTVRKKDAKSQVELNMNFQLKSLIVALAGTKTDNW